MPRLLQILNQAGDGSIHRRRLCFVILFEVLVSIPIDSGAAERAAIEELHEPNAAFEQAPGEQTIPGEPFGRFVVRSP